MAHPEVELPLVERLDIIQGAVREALEVVGRLYPYPEPPTTARVTSSLMDRAINIGQDAQELVSRLNALCVRAGIPRLATWLARSRRTSSEQHAAE